MPSYDIRVDVIPPKLAVYDLYMEAGQKRLCGDLSRLMRGLSTSLCVVTAWRGDFLCGLCRAVGDGETIVTVQELLVDSAHRRRGVGKTMLRVLLGNFPEVMRVTMITEDTRFNREFLGSMDFTACEGRGMVSFYKEGGS